MCAELKMENLHQDKTIRELTIELEVLKTFGQPNEILRRHAESAERDRCLSPTLRRG